MASPTPYTPKLDNVRGILWMLGAITALTLMFAVVKYMATELPVFVVALMRTVVSLSLLMPWLIRVGRPGIATTRLPQHFMRGFFGIAAFACIIFALKELMMADAVILGFTTPFWSILISALVLGEVIRLRRTLATVVGFIGVAMIVKPHLGIEIAMLVALISAIFTSCAMITMKSLSATEPPTRIVFYFMLTGTLLMLPPAIVTWQTPTLEQFGWLIAAGVLGAIGQDWLARAYDAGEVTVIAPFDFGRVPLAAFFGFVAFDEIPDIWTALGTLIIIGSSLYIGRREARVKNGDKNSKKDPG